MFLGSICYVENLSIAARPGSNDVGKSRERLRGTDVLRSIGAQHE